MARAERSGAGAFLVRPLGGGGRGKGTASTGVLLPLPGGQERGLAAQRPAGAVQPRSVLLSVAALTGPRAAAQTGSTFSTT
jgi:hypothetical protein